MITISKQTAMRAINSETLPSTFVGRVTIIMQKDDAERWLAALRDGKQRQAIGQLYDPETKGFCCLGLEQSCNWGGKVQRSCANSRHFDDMPTIKYLQLTKKMYFTGEGESASAPEVKTADDQWDCVSVLNDRRMSFAKIADLLEPHMAVYA